MRITAVTCMKNEAAFLLEWLAHHRAIGFTDFLVLSNGCDDGTDIMLDRLQEMGELTHLRNDGPYGQGGIQWTGFKIADKHPLVQDADWLMTLDVDEFVNIHTGDHTLDALLAALPDADAITMTWRLFGNDGVVDYHDYPITNQFSRAAPEVMTWPWRAFMFKTLYRNRGAYRKLGVHRPRAPVDGIVETTRWFDGSGRTLDERFQRNQIFSPFTRPNYGFVQLNHYPLGAMESFVLKCDRGRVNRADSPIDMDYWCERNWSDVEDTSIQQTETSRQSHLARLMADPTLANLHDAAVNWRKNRFDELMQHEANRALFGRLLMTPPARPVLLEDAQRIYKFAQMPRSSTD
ncbi:glycosyltransferase family 2 protein [Aliiroseovarius sp. S1339]|uniref:glycosyltransferase family 2 protein n=1 Tax=Aliiroseovarius sp. S1339 TaxID=2936990 RepID=UPI0020C0C830|nr:glycosyltransferase family 2 protein [Aliiroseovarius sp. S1339]MCK8464779.1 glycosyltransferase family 2 protein [Aliiroseovarius sp. S1339]